MTYHMCALGIVKGRGNASVAAQHLLHVRVLIRRKARETNALSLEHFQPVIGRELIFGSHEEWRVATLPRLLHPGRPYDSQSEGDCIFIFVTAGRVAD